MNDITFIESDMCFGPFKSAELFRIEQSDIYKGIQGFGVPSVEFLRLYTSQSAKVLQIVEAKTSCPNPDNPMSRDNFDRFVHDLQRKMESSFYLFMSLHTGRNKSADIPDEFLYSQLAVAKLDFRFIVVIKNHKVEWLDPVKSALSKSMKGFFKLWGIKGVHLSILNEDLAKRYHLVCRREDCNPGIRTRVS